MAGTTSGIRRGCFRPWVGSDLFAAIGFDRIWSAALLVPRADLECGPCSAACISLRHHKGRTPNLGAVHRMQLGFVSAILADLSLEEVVAFASRERFDCVELMCWPRG